MADASRFPPTVPHSSERRDVTYRINSEYFALRQETRTGPALPILEFDDYHVYRSADVRALPADAVPVYQTEAGGSLLIPTGAVFVRFAEGDDAKLRTKEINHAGYRITETLPYAPHAAWVRSTSGSVCDALLSFEKLAGLTGVENVAPQFVTRRHSR